MPQRRHHITALIAVVTALVLAGCGSPMPPPSVEPSTSLPLNDGPESSAPGTASPPTSTSGFAFDVDAVLGYYAGEGYRCSTAQPSATAVGYSYRSCQTTDTAGRMHVVGLVTDPDGALADAFASVQGTAQEPVLVPIDALEPLAGFLGAMLGGDRGGELLIWLAEHLGDEFAETTSGDLRVATYREADADFSRLYVEIANQAYLDAPAPSSP